MARIFSNTLDKSDWQTLDIADLSKSAAGKYDTLLDAFAAVKAAKAAFEGQLNSEANLDREKLVFGYRFGKLSVAIVPDTDRPSKPSSGVSLKTLLASRR